MVSITGLPFHLCPRKKIRISLLKTRDSPVVF